MSVLYRLSGVAQDYGARRVLDIDRLEIERGEILGLVGPSGAGKSTLLRLLNFLEPPSAGTVEFDGQPVPAEPPLSLVRRVTTVFQRPALLRRPVRDNVAYGLRVRGLSPDGRVDSAIERVGLTALARAYPRTLSGGEMQRVALARALVIDPDVLLLDEPTANLDPYNVGLIEAIVREQNAARNTTIVMVTHNVFQARRMAGRIGLLLEGQLVELAPARQFFDSPTDPRTRAFLSGDVPY
jgi:tungstate transport system ATP-binding protein